MKVNQCPYVFHPITITLETREEVDAFLALADEARLAVRPHFHNDNHNMKPTRTTQLYKSILDMSIDLHNRVSSTA